MNPISIAGRPTFISASLLRPNPALISNIIIANIDSSYESPKKAPPIISNV